MRLIRVFAVAILSCVLLDISRASGDEPTWFLFAEEEPNFVDYLDGKTLLSVGQNRSWAKVWDLPSGETGAFFKTNSSSICGDLSPDRKTLATVTQWRVTFYDIATRKRLFWVETLGLVKFSPDNSFVAIGDSKNRSIRLWDYRKETERMVLKDAGLSEAEQLAFCGDGKTLASGGEDKKLRLWDVTSGRLLHSIEAHPETEGITRLAAGPKTLLASAGVRMGKVLSPEEGKVPPGLENLITARKILGGEIKLWDAQTGECVRTLPLLRVFVDALVFSPDGRYLLAGSERTIIVWDTKTWEIARKFETGSNILSAAISPDNKQIAVGCWDKTIALWKFRD